jgi:hypothetical protein
MNTMKKLVLILSLPLLLVIACDKVKNPIEKRDTVVGTNFITKSNKSISNSYKILLEDYTGHTCGYCPRAAIQADSLAVAWGDKLVVIAVHAGGYAYVDSTNGYPTDYQTPAGTAWNAKGGGFGISAIGNPNGMINRKSYGGSVVQAYTKWKSTIKTVLDSSDQLFKVKLDVTTNYDPTVRALNTEVKAYFQSAYKNNVKISAVIIENGIIGDQKDYSKLPDHVEDYEFEHMLRGSLNGDWGDDLKSGPIAKGDSVTHSFNGFPVKPKFNDNNLWVVVFAYDAVTRGVIQAEKVKIR